MPFVDRDFINDLPNRVDIVGLINKRVALKKAGKDYKACCPFHEEKTPSFTVVPTKQIYHCFGFDLFNSSLIVVVLTHSSNDN